MITKTHSNSVPAPQVPVMAKIADNSKSRSINTVTLDYEFQFVEVGDPSERSNQGYLGTTRAHVMRDSHGRRKRSAEEGGVRDVVSATASIKSAGQNLHRFKNGLLGLTEFRKQQKRKHKTDTPRNNQGKIAELVHSKTNETDTHNVGITGSLELNHSSGFAIRKENNTISITHSSLQTLQSSHKTTTFQNSHQTSTFDITAEDCQYITHQNREDELPIHNLHLVLGAGNIDPFSCLPFSHSSNSRVQYLLHVASQNMSRSRVLGQLRAEWLSIGIQDPGMFNAVLSHFSGGNFAPIPTADSSMEGLRFRMDAMQVINGRLEHYETAIDDYNIGTVASLGLWESTNGSSEAIKTHMDGLRKMVRMRGGIKASRLNQHVRRYVLWSDLTSALALGVDPEIVNEKETTFPQDEERQSTKFRAPHNISTPPHAELPLHNKEFSIILTHLRQLIYTQGPRDWFSDSWQIRSIQDSDQLYRTAVRLLILINKTDPATTLSFCCNASFLVLDNQLRDFEFSTRIMGRMISRLQVSLSLILQKKAISSLDYHVLRAALWSLTVEAVASVTGKWESMLSFREYIVQICDVLGLQEWSDMEAILRGFLWPLSWGNYGQDIWRDIIAFRDVRYIAT